MRTLSQSLAYHPCMDSVGRPNNLTDSPSPWVLRFAALVAERGRVLDVACGAGRHARFFAAQGHPVDAVDRDLAGLVDVPDLVRALETDLEAGPWPYAGEKFAGVVVTNYLHRPLLPTLIACVASGGVFIYETFAAGNEQYGRPSRPDFLLQPGELLEAVRGQLQVIAFEDIHVKSPKPAKVQRIAAIRVHPARA